jgi:gliding motility-associated-like protein
VDDDYVKVSFHSSPDSTVKKLILERSVDGLTFQAIDSLYFLSDFVPEDGFINDTTADVHARSYYYRLVACDYCGTTKVPSVPSRTVFVQCSSTQTQNTVDWNAYELWLKGVEGYKVYRTVDGLPQPPELMGNFSSSTYSYPDLLAGVDPTKQVCYTVEAIERPGNPYLTNATSLSNSCCIIKGATVFMPNAFHPGGVNNRFRPVATFVDPQSFKMIIYNRWGQQIFETTDMVNGWNGEVEGHLVPPGLYAYIITYSSVGGQDYTKRGTVFVVR